MKVDAAVITNETNARHGADAAHHVVMLVVVLAVTTWAYAPLRTAGFLQWDDDKLLENNRAYRGYSAENLRWMFTTRLLAQYQPLSWLTYALDYRMYGREAGGYHVTNIVLHLAAAALFYFVAARLLRRAWAVRPAARAAPPAGVAVAAAAATLLFAVHPLRVETVAWLANRGYLIAGVCFLAAVLGYLQYVEARAHRRGGGGWYALALAVFALSMLARPSAMMLGFVLLLLDVYPLRRIGPGPGRLQPAAALTEKVPFLLLGALGAGLSWWAKNAAGSITDVESVPAAARVVTAFYGCVYYLAKSVWPVGLTPVYEKPGVIAAFSLRYAGSVALVIAATIAAVAARRVRPAVTVLWLYYLLMLFPVSGLFTFGPQFVADRYSHLSCLGWAIAAGYALLAAWCAAATLRSAYRAGVVAVCAVVVALLTARTRAQGRFWHDSETFWQRVFELNPNSYLANSAIGMQRAKAGRMAEAEPLLRKALRINPRHAEALGNLGNVCLYTGRYREAVDLYERAVSVQPDEASTYSNLGVAWVALGRADLAEEKMRRSVEVGPDVPLVHFNLGVLYDTVGRLADAERALEKTLQLDPEYPNARERLASIRARRAGEN